jgi:hypothetical protein
MELDDSGIGLSQFAPLRVALLDEVNKLRDRRRGLAGELLVVLEVKLKVGTGAMSYVVAPQR